MEYKEKRPNQINQQVTAENKIKNMNPSQG